MHFPCQLSSLSFSVENMEYFQMYSEIHVNMHNHGLQVLCANITSDVKGVCIVTTKLHSPLPSNILLPVQVYHWVTYFKKLLQSVHLRHY
jgi:hypothetical protein